MALRWSIAAVLLLITAGLDGLAAVWVWRRRSAVGRHSVALLLVAAGIWCAAYGLELATTGRAVREFWGDSEYLGTTLLPPAWLAFALVYTGRRDQLTWRLAVALAVEPVALLVVLIDPATHDLVRSFRPGPLAAVPEVRLGPVYWMHFGYTNLLTAIGTVLLVARLIRVSSVYLRQSLTVVGAVALPLVGNAMSSFGLPFARRYDPTSVAVSLSGLVLVWGVFRYRLLELLPVARNLAFDRLGDPVLVVDAYGRVVDRNTAAARVLGSDAQIGAPLQELLKGRDALLEATATGPEIKLDRPAGTREFELLASRLEDRRGRASGQLVHLREITARKQAERRLRWLADYDEVTGLPNRRLLSDRMAQAIAHTRRAHGRCGVLVIDLDRFKLINDSLGHDLGDQVIAEVGLRLQAGRREEDTAARLGGDEFAVLLPEIASREDASLVANRVLATLAEPMRMDGRELIITASVGVAVCPDDGASAQQLLSCADAAMYRAKAHGRNRLESGVSGSDETAADLLELGVELWHAPERGEFRLLFQPLVDLTDGSIIGMEALLRWQHPRLGVLPPAAFLPLAETSGLTTQIDRWVLQQACRQANQWARSGWPVPVAVNVAAERFRDTPIRLSADVAMVLAQTELPPHLLILEISERTVINDADPVATELRDLRQLGVGLALDDFGAGNTSLTHMRRLPLGILKIDQDLVRGVGEDTDDSRILLAVTTLAHILGMTVIAEGVERPEQLSALRRCGCNAAQGFLLSPPLDGPAATALLAVTNPMTIATG